MEKNSGVAEPLVIAWQGRMDFDGQTARFIDRVQTANGGVSLQAGLLDCIFTQPVDFSRQQGAVSSQQTDIAQIKCGDGVQISSTSEADGNLESLEKLFVRDLFFDRLTGDVRGTGPGRLTSARRGEGGLPMSTPGLPGQELQQQPTAPKPSTKPLIDAAVKSGSEQQYRASIALLGSRPVPLRVEFSKGSQGVAKPGQDSPNTHAFIELLWKPPHGAAEVIPERWLSPKTSPATYVLPTSFPPDDASIGYERGSSISQEWFTATTTAALDTADYCLEHIDELANVRRNASDRKTKLENFAIKFAEKAFRKPLPETIRKQIILHSFRNAPDLDTALRKSLLRTLTSPLFLYHEVETKTTQTLSPFVIANRLSFGLWDSIPDQKLLTAAQNGQLVTDSQIRQQADRMLDDSRAKAKVLQFLIDWLHIEDGREVVKDASLFPEFSEGVAIAMRTSLLLFLADVVWEKDSDYRKIFTDERVFINGSIAPLFNIPLKKEAAFRPVRLDDGQRAGIVTHPYIMSMLSYADSTSPIHRGVFLARSILGNVLKPPINAIAPLSATIHPELTTRERVSLQTKASACQTCHAMINPLGFALEEYDAIGRLRITEDRNGRNMPINAGGNYQPRIGRETSFYGGRELGHFLSINRDATETFVQSLFHALVKQPLEAWGRDALGQLTDRFVSKKYSIRKLIIEIALVMTKPTKSTSND